MARLQDALETFERVVRLLEPLKIRDDTPLREVIPGSWPTMGDLRELVAAAKSQR